ncbi:mucin-5AC-like isoform X2 [Sycon ciliatum]|uniref:mucin-5AC-like isoform X2 n=1 Tax=Sycon ciliatum TaxID=27933 RepID=UPI0031F62AD1
MTSNIRQVRGILTKLQENFQCVICLDLLSEPVSTACNHQFCRGCITRIAAKRSALCPLCKQPLSKRGLNPNDHLAEIVDGVRLLVEAATMDTSSLCTPPLRLSSQRISNTPAIEQFRRMFPSPVKRKQSDVATSGESTGESGVEDEVPYPTTPQGRQPVVKRHAFSTSALASVAPSASRTRTQSGPLPLARAGRQNSRSTATARKTSAKRRPVNATPSTDPVTIEDDENNDPLSFPKDVEVQSRATSKRESRRARSLSTQASTSNVPSSGDVTSSAAVSTSNTLSALQPISVNTPLDNRLTQSAGKAKRGQVPSTCEYCGKAVGVRSWMRHLTACPVLLAMQASAMDDDDMPSSNTRRSSRNKPDSQEGSASSASTSSRASRRRINRPSSTAVSATTSPALERSEPRSAVKEPPVDVSAEVADAEQVEADPVTPEAELQKTSNLNPELSSLEATSPFHASVPHTADVAPASENPPGSTMSPISQEQHSSCHGVSQEQTSEKQAGLPTDGHSATHSAAADASDSRGDEPQTYEFSPPGFVMSGVAPSTPSLNASGVQRALRRALVSSDSERSVTASPGESSRSPPSRLPTLPSLPEAPVCEAAIAEPLVHQDTPQKKATSRPSSQSRQPEPSQRNSQRTSQGAASNASRNPSSRSVSPFDICSLCGLSPAECGDCYQCTQSMNIVTVSKGIFEDPDDSPQSCRPIPRRPRTRSSTGDTNETQAVSEPAALQAIDGQASAFPTSAGPASAVETSTVQTSAAQTSAAQASAVQTNAVETNTVQASAVQASAVQISALQDSAVQDNAIQTSAAQATAVQDSTVQATVVQDSVVPASAAGQIVCETTPQENRSSTAETADTVNHQSIEDSVQLQPSVSPATASNDTVTESSRGNHASPSRVPVDDEGSNTEEEHNLSSSLLEYACTNMSGDGGLQVESSPPASTNAENSQHPSQKITPRDSQTASCVEKAGDGKAAEQNDAVAAETSQQSLSAGKPHPTTTTLITHELPSSMTSLPASVSRLADEVQELSEIFMLASSRQEETDVRSGLDSLKAITTEQCPSFKQTMPVSEPEKSVTDLDETMSTKLLSCNDTLIHEDAQSEQTSISAVMLTSADDGSSMLHTERPASQPAASPIADVSASVDCADDVDGVDGGDGGAAAGIGTCDDCIVECTELDDHAVGGLTNTEPLDTDLVAMAMMAEASTLPPPEQDNHNNMLQGDCNDHAHVTVDDADVQHEEVVGLACEDDVTTDTDTDGVESSTEDDMIPPTPPTAVEDGYGNGDTADAVSSRVTPTDEMTGGNATSAKPKSAVATGKGKQSLPASLKTLPSSESYSTQDVSRMQNELDDMKGELDFLNAVLGSETSTDNTIQKSDNSSSLTAGSPLQAVRRTAGRRKATLLSCTLAQQKALMADPHPPVANTTEAPEDNQIADLSASCLQQAVEPTPPPARSCKPNSSTARKPIARSRQVSVTTCQKQDDVVCVNGEEPQHDLSASCLELAAASGHSVVRVASPVPDNLAHDLSASCLEQATCLSLDGATQSHSVTAEGVRSIPSSQAHADADTGPVDLDTDQFTASCLAECVEASNPSSSLQQRRLRSRSPGSQTSSGRLTSGYGAHLSGAGVNELMPGDDILAADSQPAQILSTAAGKRKSPPDSDDSDDEEIGVRKKRRSSTRAAVIDDDDEEEEDEADVDFPASVDLSHALSDDSDDDLVCVLPPVTSKPKGNNGRSSQTPSVSRSHSAMAVDVDVDMENDSTGVGKRRCTTPPANVAFVDLDGPLASQDSPLPASVDLTLSAPTSKHSTPPSVGRLSSFEPTPPPAELGEFPTHLLQSVPPTSNKKTPLPRVSGEGRGLTAMASISSKADSSSLDSIEGSLPSVLPKPRSRQTPTVASRSTGAEVTRQRETSRKITAPRSTSRVPSPSSSPTNSPSGQESSPQSVYQMLNVKRKRSLVGSSPDADHRRTTSSTSSVALANRHLPYPATSTRGHTSSSLATSRDSETTQGDGCSETQDTSRHPTAASKLRIAATPPCAVTLASSAARPTSKSSSATKSVTSPPVPCGSVARPLISPPAISTSAVPTSSSSTTAERTGDYDLGFTASGRVAESSYAGKDVSLVLSTPPTTLVSRIHMLKRRHGLRLAHTLSRSSTHVVFNSDHTRVVQQSVKYFQALAARTWMVTVSWLEECYNAGKLVNEELHEVIGDRQGFMGAPRKARFSRRFDEPPLFHEFAIFLSGQFYVIGKDILAQILQIGGALILESARTACPKEKTLLVLFDPDAGDPDVPSDFGYTTILSAQWVLDSLASYRLLPMADFAPCINAEIDGGTDVLADIYDS